MLDQETEAGTKPAKTRGDAKAAEVKPGAATPCTALVVVNADPTIEQLAAGINEDHAACVAAVGTFVERATACGHKLAAAKAKVPHGEWLPWLKRECPGISERKAQRYMLMTKEELSTESDTVSDLTMTAVLQTLPGAKPKEGSYINSLIEEYEGAHRAILRGLLDRAIGTSLRLSRASGRRSQNGYPI